MEKKFQSHAVDLALDQTMPNVELVRAVFIYYNMFKFKLFFELSCTQSHIIHTDGKTRRHTDRHEYSIVAVDKPQL